MTSRFFLAQKPGVHSLTAQEKIQAPRIPLAPEALFRCETYSCVLAGKHCIERQTGRTSIQNSPRNAKRFKPPAYLEHCGSGLCVQGTQVAKALAGFNIVPPELIPSGQGCYSRRKKAG